MKSFKCQWKVYNKIMIIIKVEEFKSVKLHKLISIRLSFKKNYHKCYKLQEIAR